MSNTKEIAFKISISAKDAENNIKNVTSNIVLLEDNLKQLEAIANDADLGAAQFEQLATEIAKTVKAETILTETSAKAGNSVETLGNDVNETDEQFKKLELRIRETRVALQKAEEAGDKLTFNKLKKDLDELEDGLEATKLKSKQLDDVLVDLPGPLGGVGQALKGLDAGFKLLLANPIIAVLLGVLFLDEKLSITLLIGAVVVIFGVFLVVKTESKLTEIVSPIVGEK
jgi:predicted RNase H-like nuclease (RuvC/YqgF family)